MICAFSSGWQNWDHPVGFRNTYNNNLGCRYKPVTTCMQNTTEITFSIWPHSQLLSYLFGLLLIPFNYYADYIKLQIILCINSRWSVFLSFPLTSHISHQTRTTIVDASCRCNRFKKRLLLSIIDMSLCWSFCNTAL